jgi:ubiquinone/menaquinone biosynthesis C-methylase UbiE
MARYLALARHLWRSPVSDAVVAMVQPRPGERVVDLGAGMGAATFIAAETGAQVMAVDPTPFMRAMLRLRARAHPRGHVTVLDGAAEALPFERETIDALWTVNTVHHWTDLPGAIGELRRVLRPGGRLVLVDEDMEDPAHPFHERMKRRESHRHHFPDVDPQAVGALLRQQGFFDVEARLAPVGGRPSKLMTARG